MATTKSAKKRARQIHARTAVNRVRISRVRTFVTKVELAIAGGDKERAEAAFQAAQPEVMRGVKNGVLHRNTARRKLSRLSARIKKI